VFNGLLANSYRKYNNVIIWNDPGVHPPSASSSSIVEELNVSTVLATVFKNATNLQCRIAAVAHNLEVWILICS
jgi:hypothetical protein